MVKNQHGVSPVTVATLRAIILAAASAAVTVVIKDASSADWGTMAVYEPFILGALRVVEGVVDKARGQAPQRPGGSGPKKK